MGGLAYNAKKTESDFDDKQLKIGTLVEMEHTNDPEIAKQIAMDHLTEFPTYYRALAVMEGRLKKIQNMNDEEAAYFENFKRECRKDRFEDRSY